MPEPHGQCSALREEGPYRAFDDKARVLPLLVYANDYLSVLGPVVDVKLPSSGPLSFRLRARYAGEGYEADDSSYLAGMEERDASFWLGAAASWRNEIANLSAELLADISGNSKGSRFRLQADRRLATYCLSTHCAATRGVKVNAPASCSASIRPG